MKKVLCILLSLMMILCMMPISVGVAFAEETQLQEVGQDGDTVQAKNHVCYISSRGTVYYTSLSAAFEKADEWQEIVLLKDITIAKYALPAKNYITLNLNGHSISTSDSEGVVFEMSKGKEMYIEGDEEGSKILGTILVNDGSVKVYSGYFEGIKHSPFVLSEKAENGSFVCIMDGKVVSQSKDYPAINNLGNGRIVVWGGEITGITSAIYMVGGKLDVLNGYFKAEDKAIWISPSKNDPEIIVDITGGDYKGKYAFYEKDENNATGQEKVSISLEYVGCEGEVYFESVDDAIKNGYFSTDVSAFVDKSSKVTKSEKEEEISFSPVYFVREREKSKTSKVFSYIRYYSDGGYYEDTFYYESFEGVNLKRKLDAIKKDAQETKSDLSVTVENDVPVELSLSAGMTLKINKFDGNKISADTGCDFEIVKEDSKTITYQGTSKPIESRNIIIYSKNKELDLNNYGDYVDIKGVVSDYSVTGSSDLISVARDKISSILEEECINQGNIVALLKDNGISASSADDAKIYVEVSYDTRISSGQRNESLGETTSYGITLTPMYTLYASTAKSKDAIALTSEGNAKINTTYIKEGELDCTGKTISVKVPVAKGYVTSILDPLYVINSPDPYSDPYCYKYEAKLVQEGSDYYCVFSIPDEIGRLEFYKEAILTCWTINAEGKKVYYQHLGSSIFAAPEGATIYLTEECNNIPEGDEYFYLSCYGNEEKTLKFDKTLAPNCKINFNEYGKYKTTTTEKDNIIYYTCVDTVKQQLKKVTLALKADYTSKKAVKVSLNLNSASKKAIKAIEKKGYTVEYKFYRSTKKGSGYKLIKTTTNPYCTNLSGKKGVKYYYKAKIVVTYYGWEENSTTLKDSKCVTKKWIK